MEKPTDHNTDAPESWETVDLDKHLKTLTVGVKGKTKTPKNNKVTEDEYHNPIASYDDSEKQATNVGDLNIKSLTTSSTVVGVDPFLYEALQNPRERLTILRMEHDMDRFMRNKSVSFFEFPRISSSYVRMIAHKVAQHYAMQTRSADFVEGEGFRVIAEKTSLSAFPSVRLSDVMGVKQDIPEADNSKFKIKPRNILQSTSGLQNQGQLMNQGRSSKTVEERKEEYEKARARIFSNETGEAKEIDENAKAEKLGRQAREEDKSLTEATDEPQLEELSERKGKGRKGSKKMQKEEGPRNVAIIRDLEKEKNDPDFARNHGRYAPRYDPSYDQFQMYSYPPQPFVPAGNYNADFPALGHNSNAATHSGMYGDSSSAHHWPPAVSPHYPAGTYWPGGMVPTYYPNHAFQPAGYPVSHMPPAPPNPAEYASKDSRSDKVETSEKPATRRS